MMRFSMTHMCGLLASSALTIMAAPAVAQDTPRQATPADAVTAPQAATADTVTDGTAATEQDIVVTGSRIERTGFVAPTPTVVVGEEVFRQRAAVNVADVLNEIPSFRRTQAPESGGIGNAGANNVDLRGLGPTRTLVLLDRMRLPAVNLPGATIAGATDLNLIPSALIARADVVTGGASAAYGSDAIAGVINLQLNTDLTGVRATAQSGITEYNDARDIFLSLAGGTSFGGGRGHIVVGGEFNDNAGTGLFNTDRPWGRRNVSTVSLPTNRAAGLPANLVTDNVIFGVLTTGGLITPTASSNPAALRNLQFVVGSNGAVTTAPFAAGLYQGQIGTNMVGGSNVFPYQVLRGKTRRYNFLGHVKYDLSDTVVLWARGLYSNVETQNISAQIRAATGGTTSFLTIGRDNPYLQAALTPAQFALVPASGLTIGYLGNDFGPPVLNTTSKTYSVSGGLKGEFGEGWHWDITGQYGENESRQVTSNVPITANFLNAIAATTLNGQVVCANATARAAGCQPINILGRASYSPEAYAYAFGTSNALANTSLTEIAANLNGEPFALWAGPVSVGIGGEYRRETFVTTVDALSQAGSFMARAPRNFAPAAQSVKEAYLETIIPLMAKDWALGPLDFNGAIRLTDYSVSGSVTTWKTGLTWKPIPDIMLRGTLSRDIRAPSLTELFTASVATVPRPIFSDRRPAFANSAAYAYDVVTGGNVNLTPEIARTTSFGAVFNPRFMNRLQASVDYYKISIRQAIGATAAGTALTNCIGTGVADLSSPFCSLITFANNDPTNGAVLSVVSNNANFAEFRTKGLDFGLSYAQPLDEIFEGADGRLSLSAQATHVMEYRSTFDISALFPNGVNRAGQTGALFGGTAGLPKWLVNSTIAYRGSRFETSVQFRWISRSRQNNAQIGPDQDGYSPTLVNSINNNIIPAIGYANFNMSYNFGTQQKRNEFYLTVNNLTNQEPPLPAINNNAYYDLLGRSYRVGVRLSF
ncbi:TonB-dependent receptor plug domain-containing protein [Sphingomonas floccifaciens]|uniref:TonB-dependent receptor plug domain-containing protein n=1 Tax=Sphingomonas floccifaciens TaxID=1844115 RepID=A0ABW4N7S7_9SPHN